MSPVWIVFLRELRAVFDSTIAYIFICVFVMLTSGIFMNEFFLVSLADMSGYFHLLPAMLIIFVPTLSMRLWAEDKKHNTYELLMTLPIRTWTIVLGKYFSSCAVFLVVLAGSLPIVVMLHVLGSPDTGMIISSYLGAALLGGLILAIGLFISGLTKDQIVAYLMTVLIAALIVLSGNERFTVVMDGLWPGWEAGTRLRDFVSATPHFENFTKGIVDFRSVLYFVLLTSAFLGLNLLHLKKSRR